MTETIAHSKRGAQERDRAVATSGRWAIRLSTVVVAVALLFSLAVGVGFVGTAAAGPTCDGSDDDFAGGDGSSGESYEIEDVEQLQCVGDDAHLDDHFVLIDDIDASDTENWNDGNGFEPIGESGSPFTGVFDGDSHSISELTIDRSTNRVGLFGYGDDTHISNLRFEDIDVTGADRTGGLIGKLNQDTPGEAVVENVSVRGDITGDQYTAGIAGRTLGGGDHGPTLDNENVFVGEITGGDQVGGMTGRSSHDTEIGTSYVRGDISGDSNVGGIVGHSSSNPTTVESAYAAVEVSGSDSGAIVGTIGASADEFKSSVYWDETLESEAAGSGSATTNYQGLPTDEMQGSVAEDNMNELDFENTWTTVTGDYPVFQWQAAAADTADELEAQDTTWVPDVEGEITVVATESGVPVEGETISVDDDDGPGGLDETDTATTDENGEATFTFEESTRGDYTVEFEAEDDSVTDTAAVTIQYYANDEQPYEIENWYHLDNVRENLGADFELVADLDEETAGYDDVASETANDDKGLDPIGEDDNAFTGTFDGDGYTIADLYIDRPSEDNVGLFGYIEDGGYIQDLTLADADVTGEDTTGTLVGYKDDSSDLLDNVIATGSIAGDGAVGGLVGRTRGDITAAEVDVTVTAQSSRSGGLLGRMSGDDVVIRESAAHGDVTSDSRWVGGLLGRSTSSENQRIVESYATGNVSGDFEVGGLVGSLVQESTVRDSYATGTVEGNSDLGGLIGDNAGFVERSYAVGDTDPDEEASGDVGGLVATNVDGTVEDSYWDTETTGQYSSDGSVDEDGQTTMEMTGDRAPDNMLFDFSGEGEWETTSDDPDNGFTLSYPTLQDNTQEPAPSTTLYADGDGSDSNPYEIETWEHLDNVRENLDDEFALIADLDEETDGYDDVVTDPENGFEPIGDFAGTFDGNGHEIADLVIDRPDESVVGLFGDNDGLIKNVTVTDADITGGNVQVGGLVGMNHGEVVDSHATGAVIGDNDVGGLVGFNDDGDITSSFATADVTGDGGVGGLVGLNHGDIAASFATGDVEGDLSGGLVGNNDGTVSESYATGAVTGDNDVGGLVGLNHGEIALSFATGAVTGDERVGGLVGLNEGEIVDSESHWDTESTEQMDGIGDGPGGAIGLETAEMQGDSAPDNMDAFDFGGTWETVEADDDDATDDWYPILQALDRQTQFEIGLDAESELGNLNITGEEPPVTITEGDDEDVSVDVENAGDEEGTFTVDLTIKNGGEQMSDSQDVENLAGGDDETVTFEGVTADLNAADSPFEVEVSTEDDTLTSDLMVEEEQADLSIEDFNGELPDGETEQADLEDVEVTLSEGAGVEADNVGEVTATVTNNNGVTENDTVDFGDITASGEQTETFFSGERSVDGLDADDYEVTVVAEADNSVGEERTESFTVELDEEPASGEVEFNDLDAEDGDVTVDISNLEGLDDVALEIINQVEDDEQIAKLTGDDRLGEVTDEAVDIDDTNVNAGDTLEVIIYEDDGLTEDLDSSTGDAITTGTPDCSSVDFEEENGVYQISNPAELQCMGDGSTDTDLGDDFELTEDINLTAANVEEWNSAKGWDPIDNFEGTLDGNGNVVEGLYVNRPDNDGNGLFGNADNSEDVVVENLRLEELDVTGGDDTGGLAGEFKLPNGIVQNVSVSGNVESLEGAGRTGGFIARPWDLNMENRNVFRGEVRSDADLIGGLAGRTSGNSFVGESYAQAEITVENGGGSEGVGLLLGFTSTQQSTFENLYAAGNITDKEGSGKIGAISGDTQDSDTFVDVYWDTEQDVPAGDGIDAAFGDDGEGIDEGASDFTGLETEQMQGGAAEENMALEDDWENPEVWQSVPGGYPVFQWQAGAVDQPDEFELDDINATAADGEIIVRAFQSGVPVEGNIIRVLDEGDVDEFEGISAGDEDETNQDGEAIFAFTEEDGGDYDLTFATEDEEFSDTLTVTVRGNPDELEDGELEAFDTTALAGVTESVPVRLNDSFANPVQDATIELTENEDGLSNLDTEAQTNSTGFANFEFVGTDDDEYQVSFQSENEPSLTDDATVDVTFAEEPPDEIDAGDEDEDVGQEGTVTVSATDGDGNEVKGARIDVADDDGLDIDDRAITDENGEAEFEFFAGFGEFDVEFEATQDDSVTGTATVDVSDVDCGEVEHEIEDGVYQVSNAAELQCIGNSNTDMDDDYELVDDINLTAANVEDWNGGDGFDPIGECDFDDESFECTGEFTGTFDGNGNIIEGLVIDREGESENGLFGRTEDATLENIRLESVDVRGGTEIGGLVGVADSTRAGVEDAVVENVSVSGTIETTDEGTNAAGIVGFSTGGGFGENAYGPSLDNQNVFVGTVDAEGVNQVGGITGRSNFGTDVSVGYVQADITGGTDVGGIVGHSSSNPSTFGEMYFAGDVEATGEGSSFEAGDPGAIVGQVGSDDDEFQSNVYWDKTKQEDAAGDDDPSSGDDPTLEYQGLATDEMQGDAAEANMDGFDFEDTWQTVSGDYPVFQWQAAAAEDADTLSADNVTVTAGGQGEITVVATEAGGTVEDEAVTVINDGGITGIDVGDSQVTGEDGDAVFEFTESDPGTYTLEFEAEDDSVTETVTVTVEEDEEVVASASANTYTPSIQSDGETRDVRFQANRSQYPGENPTFSWSWEEDGTEETATGEVHETTFTVPETVTVELEVSAQGKTDTDTVNLTVEDSLTPDARLDVPEAVKTDESVTFDASESEDNVEIAAYEWDFGNGTTASGSDLDTTDGSYAEPGVYDIELTVVDTSGNEDTNTTALTVEGANATIPDTPLEFDDVGNGSTASTSIPVENDGTAPLEFTADEISGENASAFDVTGVTELVGAGDVRDVDVTFSPTEAEDKTAELELETNSTREQTVTIDLSGTGVESDLVPEESSIDFGDVDVGDQQEREVTIENDGADSATITDVTLGDDDFELVGTPGEIDAGESATVTVAFEPETDGAQSTTLRIEGDDDTAAVSLTGTGLGPEIRLETDDLEFDTTGIDTTTTDTIEIRNTGSQDLDIEETTVTGSDEAVFTVVDEPDVITTGESEPVEIRFEPEEPVEHAASLVIEHNDTAAGEQTIGLSGDAVAAEISVDRTTVDFGETEIDESYFETVFISNDGRTDANLTVDDLRLVGANSEAFDIESPDAPLTLEPGDEQEIELNLTTQVEEPRRAQLQIRSDAGNQPLANVWLSNTRGYIIVQEISNPTVNIDGDNLEEGSEHLVNVSTPSTQASNVTIDELGMTTERSDFEMNLSNAEEPFDTEFDADDDTALLQYVELDHIEGDPDVTFDDTAVHYRVNVDAVPDEAAGEDVTLHRYNDSIGEWAELDAQFLEERRSHYHYEVETPGFSEFAVTAPEPTDPSSSPSASTSSSPSPEPDPESNITVTGAVLAEATMTEGETATVTVTLENDGDADGEYTLELTADGTALATESVAVDAGETTNTTLSIAPDAGEYDLELDGQDVETLVVEPDPADDDDVTDDDDGVTGDDDPADDSDEEDVGTADDGTSSWILLLLGALGAIVLLFVLLWRRREGEDETDGQSSTE